MIHLFYGVDHRYIDITNRAFELCSDGERLYVAAGDAIRAKIFTDPAYGVTKNIIVLREGNGNITCTLHGPDEIVELELNQQEKQTYQLGNRSKPIHLPANLSSAEDKINFLHAHLKFAGGSMKDELPEQNMIIRFLDPRAKVLEIGANIGRGTLTIASALEDPKNLVTCECDPVSVELLRNNRFANGFDFHIEPSAISYRRLIQKGWNTVPSDDLLPDYHWVNTITFEELARKYAIEFDTLVADCEGALYYILKDNKSLLQNISTIILEADYHSIDHKKSVESVFAEFGLRKIYSESLHVSLRFLFPEECADSFYEVWTKDSMSRSATKTGL